MSLFQLGMFNLASGHAANWKIECDALKTDDWKALAAIIGEHVEFGDVRGVPRGGLKLEKLLRSYRRPDHPICLIVDDVYTTGMSMHRMRDGLLRRPDMPARVKHYAGVAVFARAPIAAEHGWISALFQMGNLGQNRAVK